MIDIHTHVLPGIDDGADDLETAVAMCRLAFDDGCETVFATPHQRTELWDNSNLGRLAGLRRDLEEATGGRPRVLAGGEIRVDRRLVEDLADPASAGIEPLAGSRYLLLELDRQGLGPDPVETTHEVTVAGWVPIYAHPELIPWLAADLGLMGSLAAAGALFQVTATSLTGEWGRETRTVTRRMIDAELVHFVASDAHGSSWRPPGLSRVRRELAARWGEETAERLTSIHAAAVAENRPLPVPVGR